MKNLATPSGRATASFLALVFLLSACGGSGGGDSGSDTTGAERSATTAASESTDDTTDDSDDTDKDPQMAFFEKVYGDSKANAAKQLEVENKTAACMRSLGWEYIPVDYSVMNEGETFLEFDQDAFGKQWGYGIATTIGHEDENPYGGPGGEKEFVDPNQAYVESLSESDRNAYYEDLYGPQEFEPSDTVPADTIAPYDPATAKGCSNESYYAVYGDTAMFNDDLSEDLSKLEEDINSDERMVAATEKWVACMNDAGFKQFTKRDEIYSYLSDKVSEAMGWDEGSEGGAVPATIVSSARGFAGTGAQVSTDGTSGDDTVTDDSGADDAPIPVDGPMGGFDYTPEQLAKIKPIATEEMRIYAADMSCQDKHLRKVETEVRTEYQNRFLDEHADALGGTK
ncbi:MAG: hypothetical protein AB7V43_02095 [Acidimicrobiia bacterium]